MKVRVNDNVEIPEDELTFKASRSGGPGGQNVNKVSSRVTLSFGLDSSPSLSEGEKARIRQKLSNRISKEGVLQVVSQSTRSQELNRAAAIGRFAELLAGALHVERPRVKTRTPRGAKEARIEEKKKRTVIKEARSKWRGDE